MDDILYTVEETATLLKCNKGKVHDLIHHGLLKPLKLGRLKITRYELLIFLKKYSGFDLTDLENIKEIINS